MIDLGALGGSLLGMVLLGLTISRGADVFLQRFSSSPCEKNLCVRDLTVMAVAISPNALVDDRDVIICAASPVAIPQRDLIP